MAVTAQQFFSKDSRGHTPSEEAFFFSSLKMRNGTFKSTHPSRLDDTESALARAVAGKEGALRAVLDVGVSWGATTIDLSALLLKLGVHARITATDLYIDANIVQLGPRFRILTDSNGWILQYDLAGVAIRSWIRRLDYFTLACLPRLLARVPLSYAAQKMIQRGVSSSVKLVSPRLSQLPNVYVVEDNIMVYSPKFAHQFDFIRAANILNSNYFSANQLRRGIANIRSYLSGPGSLLLVARSNRDEASAGSLFELTPARNFRVVERIGSGSEIEHLLLTTSPG